MALPATGHRIDLMIAGAQKAGTSSLKAMLEQHPRITGHIPLECDWFLDPGGRDWATWCDRFFQPVGDRVLAKQAYLTRTDAAVLRLREISPDCRIVFVLREPVSRLISAYGMGRNDWIRFPISDAVQAIDGTGAPTNTTAYNTLVRPGDYEDAARKLLAHFPRNQLDFILFEDLKTAPDLVSGSIIDSLGLERQPIRPVKENAARVARFPALRRRADRLRGSPAIRALKERLPYPVVKRLRNGVDRISLQQAPAQAAVQLSPDDRARLAEYYACKNRGFTALTGVDLPW